MDGAEENGPGGEELLRPLPVHTVARRLRLLVKVFDPAGHDIGARVQRGPAEGSNHVWERHVVVIQQDDKPGPGGSDTGIPRCAEIQIGLPDQPQPQRSMAFFDSVEIEPGGLARAAVIDHDDAEALLGLPHQTLQILL